jgi:hypothetical protein
LWVADDWVASDLQTAITQFGNTLVIGDPFRQVVYVYSLDVGGVSTIATGYTVAGAALMAASKNHFLQTPGASTTIRRYPGTARASSGVLRTSLFDAENSLTKHFQSVRFDGEIPTGASVDLAYRVNDLDGSYTSIQTGAQPGVEYQLPGGGVTGRAISIEVTLNLGTSTDGPKVRRLYLRAAPRLDTFRRGQYILDLSGRDGEAHIVLRDGTRHRKDGHEMAQDLMAAAVATSPIQFHDRFGSFHGIIDPEGFSIVEMRPEVYVAQVRARQT